MTIEIDHELKAIGRLRTQYRESTNLIAYIKALLIEANTIEKEVIKVIEDRWLNNAKGANLDIIGKIVGQKRTIEDITQLIFFGFDGHIGADSFGSTSDPGVGSRFRSNGEPITGKAILSDVEYLLFIKSRIIKNHTIVTSNDVAGAIRFLLQADSSYAIDYGGATAKIGIGRLLTSNEKLLVLNGGLIPRPAGVTYRYSEYQGGDAFAFAGVDNAKGFNTGIFASTI